MKTFLVIVHQATSTTGLVGKLLQNKGYELDIRIPSIGQELPKTMDNHQGVIIFGGPMSANDDGSLPHIRTELEWIPIALDSKKPLLGICLGAQLLARVLGATVAPHPQEIREIGYFPIKITNLGKSCLQNLQYVYHWHNEGFELPSGAVQLASGEIFTNQAFVYGKAYGVQFHPEITRGMIKIWTTKAADQLTLPGAQSVQQQLEYYQKYGHQCQQWLDSFLPVWLGE